MSERPKLSTIRISDDYCENIANKSPRQCCRYTTSLKMNLKKKTDDQIEIVADGTIWTKIENEPVHKIFKAISRSTAHA